MDVEFIGDDLARLENDSQFTAGYSIEVVRGFRKVMRFIRAATDERDLRAIRGMGFEKLRGDRAHQHSFRINKQWRLIVQLKQASPANVVVVIEIIDYH
ncbi:MAG: type II toxin-antitoxin system RelE/ParE family toxin [Planctomycetes bacterium]|nr:type II toxin-antitoxin system RelE/ParE family toxin [Planctomycetota bacterium]